MGKKAGGFISGSRIANLERIQKLTSRESKLLLDIDAKRLRTSTIFDRLLDNIWKKLPESQKNYFFSDTISRVYSEPHDLFFTEQITYTFCKEIPPAPHELKKRADEALKNFRETGEAYFADEFRDLITQYKNTLLNRLREIKYILASVKIPSVKKFFFDLRTLVRKLSKLISRNIDDENILVYNSSFKLSKVIAINIKNHEYKYIKSNRQRLGVFLP